MVAQFIKRPRIKAPSSINSRWQVGRDESKQVTGRDGPHYRTVPSSCPSATTQLSQMVTSSPSRMHLEQVIYRSRQQYHFAHGRQFLSLSAVLACPEVLLQQHGCSLLQLAYKNSNIYIFGINLRNFMCLIQRFLHTARKLNLVLLHSNIGSKWPKFKMCVRKLAFNSYI